MYIPDDTDRFAFYKKCGSVCCPAYDIFSLQVHFRKFVILGILDVTIYSYYEKPKRPQPEPFWFVQFTVLLYILNLFRTWLINRSFSFWIIFYFILFHASPYWNLAPNNNVLFQATQVVNLTADRRID